MVSSVRYFLVLMVADLLVCVFFISIIRTIEACTFSSWTEAYVFAHFGWPVVNFLQSVATFTILWLAMDRFLAVWLPWTYRHLDQMTHFMWIRMLITVVVCFLSHIFYSVNASVYTKEQTVCGNGTFVTVSDTYSYSYEDWAFGYLYAKFYYVLIRWIPSLLLAVCNTGLVVAVLKGKIRLKDNPQKAAPAANVRKSLASTNSIPLINKTTANNENIPTKKVTTPNVLKNKEKRLVMTMIAMSTSYIVLMLPITIYLSLSINAPHDHCCEYYPLLMFRDVGDVFQLIEHVIHMFFLLALNDKFKRELKVIMRFEKPTGTEDMSSGQDTSTQKDTGATTEM